MLRIKGLLRVHKRPVAGLRYIEEPLGTVRDYRKNVLLSIEDLLRVHYQEKTFYSSRFIRHVLRLVIIRDKGLISVKSLLRSSNL